MFDLLVWTPEHAWALLYISYFFVPLIGVGIYIYIKNPKLSILTPVKVVSIILLILFLIKQIVFAIAISSPEGASKIKGNGYFPFNFSDTSIFLLLFLSFLKEGQFKKVIYFTWMCMGLWFFIVIVGFPKSMVAIPSNFPTDFSNYFSFISHYVYFFIFIWLMIWRPYKLEFKLVIWVSLTFFILSCYTIFGAYLLHTNFLFFLTYKKGGMTVVDPSLIMPWWTIVMLFILSSIPFIFYYPFYFSHKFGPLQERFIKKEIINNKQ